MSMPHMFKYRPPPPGAYLFRIGETVLFKDQLTCTIRDITLNVNGCRVYSVQDYTTGKYYQAQKIDMKPVSAPAQVSAVMDNFDDTDLMDLFNNDGDLNFDQALIENMDSLCDISGVEPLAAVSNIPSVTVSSPPSVDAGNDPMGCAGRPSRPIKKPSRFVEVSDQQLDNIASMKDAKGTKKNTKWGISAFRGKNITS